VSQADENVSRQQYTKTWQVEAGPLLQGDGGDVQKLSPIVRGTTAELEARHSQLDEILVGLLNEATANKGQAPTSGSVTLTSQRVSKTQPQVKQYTETSTMLKTAQRHVDEQASSRRPAVTDDVPLNGPSRAEPTTEPRRAEPASQPRAYVSDSEDVPSRSWLVDQRMKLRAGRRGGWRERDRQLVSELRSAQTWRTRAQSESEMLDTAAGGRGPPSSSYQSDRYELRPGRYVSGVERRPFSTQQTMYTFGVSPDLTPPVPERTDSSRDAMARQRRSQGTCSSLTGPPALTQCMMGTRDMLALSH